MISTQPATAPAASPAITDLDLSGLKCPLPALRTRKALRGAASGAIFRVVCTDPMAALDIPNLLRETGDHLDARQDAEGKLVFVVRKA
jgi:tRNA 2-thiouridine synthesizing protein A